MMNKIRMIIYTEVLGNIKKIEKGLNKINLDTNA